MKILADENMRDSILAILPKCGVHNVVSISGKLKGMSDNEVMNKAITENRVILTNDKDFYKKILPKP